MTPDKIQSFRSILLRNSIVSLLCLLLVLVCFILNYLERREEREQRYKYAYYVQTNGAVIPAEYALRRDNIEVEIRHHLSMFVNDWYTLDQNSWEKKAEAAGWLAGNSVRDMYIVRRQQGFYNHFIQSNVSQVAQISDLQIEAYDNGEYGFQMAIDIRETATGSIRLWRVLASGQIKVVERSWPNNPHGLLIEPFLEVKIVEIKPDNE